MNGVLEVGGMGGGEDGSEMGGYKSNGIGLPSPPGPALTRRTNTAFVRQEVQLDLIKAACEAPAALPP